MRKVKSLIVVIMSVIMVFSAFGCNDNPVVPEKFEVTIVNGATTTGLTDFAVTNGDTAVSSGTKLEKDTEVSVSWTAASGYKAQLYINDAVVTAATSPYKYTVAAATKIEVKTVAMYTVTIVNGALTPGLESFDVKQGTVSLNKASNTDVETGSQLTISWAVASTHTAELLIDDEPVASSDNPLTITVTKNTKIQVATTAKTAYSITLANGTGDISATGLSALSVTKVGGSALVKGQAETVYAGTQYTIAWTAEAGYYGAVYINGTKVAEATESPYTLTVSGNTVIEVCGRVIGAIMAVIDTSDAIVDSYQIKVNDTVVTTDSFFVVSGDVILVSLTGDYDSSFKANGEPVALGDDGYEISITTDTEFELVTNLTAEEKADYTTITISPISQEVSEYINEVKIYGTNNYSYYLGFKKYKIPLKSEYGGNISLSIMISLSDTGFAEGKKAVVFANDTKLNSSSSIPHEFSSYGSVPAQDTVYTIGVEDRAAYNVSLVNAEGTAWELSTSSDSWAQFEALGFKVKLTNSPTESFAVNGIVYAGATVSLQYTGSYYGVVKLGDEIISMTSETAIITVNGDVRDLVITVTSAIQQMATFTIDYNTDHISYITHPGVTNGGQFMVSRPITVSWYVDTYNTGNDFIVKVYINEILVNESTASSSNYAIDTTNYADGIDFVIVVEFSTEDYVINFVSEDDTPVAISSLSGLTAEFVGGSGITGSSASYPFGTSANVKFTNNSATKSYYLESGYYAQILDEGADYTFSFNKSGGTIKVYEVESATVTFKDEQGNVLPSGLDFSLVVNDSSFTTNPARLVKNSPVKITNNSSKTYKFVVNGQDITLASYKTSEPFELIDNIDITVKDIYFLGLVDMNGVPFTNASAAKLYISGALNNSAPIVLLKGSILTVYNDDYNNPISISYGETEVEISAGGNVRITVDGPLTIKALNYNSTAAKSCSILFQDDFKAFGMTAFTSSGAIDLEEITLTEGEMIFFEYYGSTPISIKVMYDDYTYGYYLHNGSDISIEVVGNFMTFFFSQVAVGAECDIVFMGDYSDMNISMYTESQVNINTNEINLAVDDIIYIEGYSNFTISIEYSDGSTDSMQLSAGGCVTIPVEGEWMTITITKK